MIANVVAGRVDPTADESVIAGQLVPAFQGQPGYQGGYWLRQPDGDEVLTVTLWDSEEALKAALGSPHAREVTARTSRMFVDGPHFSVYRLVAKG